MSGKMTNGRKTILMDAISHNPNQQTHCGMKQRRADHYPRQDLQRKYNFFHIIYVCNDKAWRFVYTISENIEHHQTGEQHQRKFRFGVTAHTPPRLENKAKNKCVNSQHK
jgi:hypothetical protein